MFEVLKSTRFWWVWGYLPIISVCRRLRQEDCKGLEASLRYIVRSSFETAAAATIATMQSLWEGYRHTYVHTTDRAVLRLHSCLFTEASAILWVTLVLAGSAQETRVCIYLSRTPGLHD